MWIVRLALSRPFTIAVAAILIFVAGIFSVCSMQVDIFPTIDIPVVGVVWNYPGLSASEMEKRVVILHERAMSTSVNGIARIESQSIPGIGLIKVYFQEGTNIGGAIAQISAVALTAARSMPPGMQQPIIIQSNAANVSVIQLTLSSPSIPEERLFDYALNVLRLKLFTIPGLSLPAPYGGKSRQINIDLDPHALSAKGISPFDVTNAVNLSNVILPAGTARIGPYEYNVALNSSPLQVSEFNDLPIQVFKGAPVVMGDVAKISDSFADQTNIVRVNGNRSTYLNVLKKADASTLAVVEAVKRLLPSISATAPEGLKLSVDFDQSGFVKAAIGGVLHEAAISSVLVSIMILFFLASWRSVIIVCTSIPLAILGSIIGLKLTGHSINIMTLGGLSLAIGMLVDDATVEVENIHRNRHLGKPLTVAILSGAQQIALPAIMATLAICIVFFPVVLLTGPARYLFTAMALSVVFAMLASYILSRTLVPLLARLLMSSEPLVMQVDPNRAGFQLNRWFERFGRLFDWIQRAYNRALDHLFNHRRLVLGFCGVLVGLTFVLPSLVGRDFFPQTDTGLMKIHFRAPSGTRIEETEKLIAQAETHIRHLVPKEELQTINSMIGVPIYYNLGFVPTDNTGGMDAEILVNLREGHAPTDRYVQAIRRDLRASFPGSSIYFQPADSVNQVLNFGLSAPIDVQFEGADVDYSYSLAQRLRDRMDLIAGAVDVNIKQVQDYPKLDVTVDRIRAARLGLTQRDVANSVIISLSSSALVSPSFYLNPRNNVNYTVVVKTPLAQLASLDDLLETPLSSSGSFGTSFAEGDDAHGGFMPSLLSGSLATLPQSYAQRLGNVATLMSTAETNQYSHQNVQRVVNITANVENRDLGSVIADIEHEIQGLGTLRPGTKISIRGQGETMNESFSKLGLGLVVSILLVFLLMVVLFQSWLDPFIVMVAVPGAFVGILWTLLITHTTINVTSLMGSIMAVGIAASNSILLVSFANDIRVEKGLSALEAARQAGQTRLRPVLMTALAMIIGMFPAALGLGEGGEQNAPLGRAVIGGLLCATCVTLLIIPLVYSVLRKNMPTLHLLDERLAREEAEKNAPSIHPDLQGAHS